MRLDHVSERGHTYEESCPMENLLFKYQTADFPTEIVEEEGWNVRVLPSEVEVEYAQEAWKKGYGVRRLFANALRGRGAMLASNKGRVYVLDSSIPHENEMVSRGYLKVDGSAMVSSKYPRPLLFPPKPCEVMCANVTVQHADRDTTVDTCR